MRPSNYYCFFKKNTSWNKHKQLRAYGNPTPNTYPDKKNGRIISGSFLNAIFLQQ